ncbi:hypothetical protein BGZ46_002294 [Entomortierella lignicola]|nr:hypothetical protein BGZ46_002294 [Entomortierella lignicola]
MPQPKRNGAPQIFRPVYRNEISGAVTPLPRTVNIKPRFNRNTGEFIILWNDIKMELRNPLHVWHGNTAVPFLIDDNFEFVQPLRMSVYPNTVLDVVIETPITYAAPRRNTISSTLTSAPFNLPSPPITESNTSDKSSPGTPSQALLATSEPLNLSDLLTDTSTSASKLGYQARQIDQSLDHERGSFCSNSEPVFERFNNYHAKDDPKKQSKSMIWRTLRRT